MIIIIVVILVLFFIYWNKAESLPGPRPEPFTTENLLGKNPKTIFKQAVPRGIVVKAFAWKSIFKDFWGSIPGVDRFFRSSLNF